MERETQPQSGKKAGLQIPADGVLFTAAELKKLRNAQRRGIAAAQNARVYCGADHINVVKARVEEALDSFREAFGVFDRAVKRAAVGG